MVYDANGNTVDYSKEYCTEKSVCILALEINN